MAAPTPSPTLAPPVSDAPAAGICAQAEGEWATVEINADVPSPRCLQVTALQKLKVVNRTAAAIQVRLAGYSISVPAGGEGTIPVAFGSYLAPGVHSVRGRALQRSADLAGCQVAGGGMPAERSALPAAASLDTIRPSCYNPRGRDRPVAPLRTSIMIHTITLPTPFEVGPINVYLFEGPELTLVDTGARTRRTMETLREGLSAHGYAVSDLRQIIVTHAHADHFGLAAQIVAESGARVLTHRRNQYWLTDFANEWVRRHDFYAAVFEESGLSPELREAVRAATDVTARFADSVPVARLLDEGDVLTLDGAPWQVLFLPGHAGGLICLYQPDRRLLLSSDHLLKHITSNPLLEPPARGETVRRRSLVEYLASLRRVAAWTWPWPCPPTASPSPTTGR